MTQATSKRRTVVDPQFKLLPDKWDMDSVAEHLIVHYRYSIGWYQIPEHGGAKQVHWGYS